MIINSERESGPSRSDYARGVVREYGMRDDRFKSILNPVPDSAFRSSERGGLVRSDRICEFLSGIAGAIKLPILSLAAWRSMLHP
ncbi:hypothetical protein, partial [Paraburkholderia domus]|uniref:hypothetical protein n=1 Tax=Paraburkholderia domus TaxID=2793075 RepID=UPI001B8A91D6